MKKWLESASLYVKGVKLNWKDEAHGCTCAEIEDLGFPSKALRHLNICTFCELQPVSGAKVMPVRLTRPGVGPQRKQLET